MNTFKKGTTISPPVKATTTLRNLQRISPSAASQTQKTKGDLRKASVSKSPAKKTFEEDDDCNIPDETPRQEESSRQRPPEIKQIKSSF